MTWVVGSPTLFSCIGLADVQATITLADGRVLYEDCVQKIFPLCADIAVGFSGSIRLGFGLIKDAHKNFGFPYRETERSPYIVVHKWSRRLRWLYKNLSNELARPVHFLVLGVSPIKTGLPITQGWILRSPEFSPERIPFAHARSIGSGNRANECLEILNKVNRQSWNQRFASDGLLRAELATPGGFAAAVGLDIALDAADLSILGVSQHFHLCSVKRGEVSIWPNDHQTFNKGHERDVITMPPTVAGWSDFVKHIKLARGVDVNGTDATA